MNDPVEDIAGYKVVKLGVQRCIAEVVASISAKRPEKAYGHGRWLACFNPHSYVVALSDEKFSAALKYADWLVPDGQGIVVASRILGGTIRKRITGSDVFFGVLSKLDELGDSSVFFLGSTEATLAKIRARMSNDYPNVYVSGTYSPPFKDSYSEEETDEMVKLINTAAPDVLWVGLTAPKQEKWIADVLDRLDVKFAAAIGAVFDFYSGQIRRSHPHFQRLGLEWLPRLMQEPRRLWRRMFVSAPIFVWHILLVRVGRARGQ